MRRLIAGVVALSLAATLFIAPALAQSGASVRQSGNSVTPATVPYWVTNGVIGDSVSAADSPVSSFGVTNNGGAGFCVSSDRVTAAGRNQLCFGTQTNGAATISLQNYGTASPQGLNYVINGVTVSIPTGGGTFILGNGSFTAGDVPCFLNSSGTVQDCGLNLSTNGTVLAGTWQGSAIGLAFGGTGAATASAARTNLGLGSIATQNANAVAITGGSITGMPSPSAATDVATKTYVDSTAQGLIILAQSRLATAAVLPNTPTYANGASGVGATLTSAANTTLTVDGTATALNDVILVKNQAAPAQNGIYTQTQVGTGSVPWILTRATYFDQAAEIVKGSYTFITSGTANVSSSWVLQTTVTTVGTDAITFNQFASAGVGVTSIGGLTGAVTLGNGLKASGSAVLTAEGVDANVLNAQAANYPIVAADAGSTIYVTGGPFTVTLPGVGGFAANATVKVCNGNANTNTSHAVRMSGFPIPIMPRLYPKQCASVAIENGAWNAVSVPGRFRPTYQTTLFIDTVNGSNANDGLISNASGNALADNQTCVNILGQEYDLLFSQPICSLTAGQNGGPVSIIGQFVNSSVMFFNGNGGQATAQATAGVGTAALFLGDFAPYVISVSMTWDCTSAASNCTSLSLHQQGGMDLNSGTILKGSNTGQTGLACDSMCKINGGATVTLAGTLGDGFIGNLGSMFNLGGGITLANGTTISRDIARMQSGSQLNFSGGLNAGSSISVAEIFGVLGNGSEVCVSNLTVTGSFGGARQWQALNNGLFANTSSQAVPGSAPGINSSSGWANGIVVNGGTNAAGC